MLKLAWNIPSLVGGWVAARSGGFWVDGMGPAVGLIDPESKRIVAGATFEEWTGTQFTVHCAFERGAYLRALLREGYWFAFELRRCKRLLFPVWDDNAKILKVVRQLGAVEECRQRDARPGGDILLYVLWADAARRWR